MLGKYLKYDTSLSFFERVYISIFGVPINGLRIRARRVLPLINHKYKSIMDAGCGTGIFSFEIATKFPNTKVTGIDIDESAVKTNKKIAEKLNLKNCFFEVLNLENLSFQNKFDLILSIDNLEHIEDESIILNKFYNALISDGELILHVPGLYRRWKFFGWATNFHIEGHFRPGYTKEQISTLLNNAGFIIKDSYYTYGWIETITNNISYWITKAQMKNKLIYAAVFPFLNFFSYLGRNSKPNKGAGVLIIAQKHVQI